MNHRIIPTFRYLVLPLFSIVFVIAIECGLKGCVFAESSRPTVLNPVSGTWNGHSDALANGIGTVIGTEQWNDDDFFGKPVFQYDEHGHVLLTGSTDSFASPMLPFSVSAYVKTAPRPENVGNVVSKRTVLFAKSATAEKVFEVFLDEYGDLYFDALAMPVPAACRYLSFDDARWHCLRIEWTGSDLRFYRNSVLATVKPVDQIATVGIVGIHVGATPDGLSPFFGSIARVRFGDGTPPPNENGNLILEQRVPDGNPTWTAKKGIVFDRFQKHHSKDDLPHLPFHSSCVIVDRDIEWIKAMGFEHVKLLFTSDSMTGADGLPTPEGLQYIEKTVGQVLRHGLTCMICMHPEPAYKNKYLADWTEFELLLTCYERLGRFIDAQVEWTPETVAFQLMTEPFANVGDWTLMTERMWNATRRGAKRHTLLLCSDRAGNIEAMMEMTPLPDPNLYYCFTTYEPYVFGFNALHAHGNPANAWWRKAGPIPYPASPERIAERMECLLADVPEEKKETAREIFVHYGNGLFNRDWHFERAQRVDRWASSFGGKVRVMCTEFGCYLPPKTPGDSVRRYGPKRTDMETYIDDIRSSFDAFDIGWSYWSYNETFTVFDFDKRVAWRTPETESEFQNWLDLGLLRALGRGPPHLSTVSP